MTTPYSRIANIHNPSVSGRPPASWGDQIDTNLEFFAQPPSVSAYSAGNSGNLTNGAFVAIAMDAENWDTDAFHSTSSNNSRFTVPTGFGGKYLLTGMVSFSTSGAGVRALRVAVNGTHSATAGHAYVTDDAPPGAITCRMGLSCIISLSAGDYVEVFGYQTSGGALDGNAYLQMLWVSL